MMSRSQPVRCRVDICIIEGDHHITGADMRLRPIGSGHSDLQILLGEPKAAVRSMFVPFLIAFAIVEVNQFVDTFWISGLGVSSASAISTVVPFYAMLMSAGVGISVGATTTIAFRLGKGDAEGASGLAANSFYIAVILSVVGSVLLALILDPALTLMGVDDIRSECWGYMLPMMVLSPAMILLSVMGGTLRGEGAAGRSTVLQISTAVFNIVLDPIMIYTLGLGIAGAGLATGVAAVISLSIGASWYARKKTVLVLKKGRDFHPDRALMSEVFFVGGPKTANEMIAGVMMFIQRIFFVVAGGVPAVMMYNYPWRFISLFSLPSKAFENSLVPVGSAANGQADAGKMWAAYTYCMKYSVAVALVAAVAIYAFAEPLMSIMTYESSMHEMLPKLVWILQLSVVMLPFIALRGVGNSLLQSMKKARIPMYFDLIWGSVRMVLYALSAYGFLGVDPFDGIIYTMVIVYSLSGVLINILAVWQFREFKRSGKRPETDIS